MKKKLLFSACACMAVVLGLGCSEVNGVPSRAPSGYPEGPKTMVDAGATAITRTLYENLFVLAERGTMFGHQIPTLYGLDNNRKWWAGDDTDLSDTKYLTGSHPAVCGWELSNIELDMETNIDGELFTEVRKHIIAAFGRGAVNTISWHCANPVSGGNSWDGTRAVYSIIPGGENHEKFKGWLDKVADFMLSLKSPEGEPIPLIFRPWHEHTGSGFWWGKGNATAQEFVALWQFTISYLRDVKGLHNLIWAYSPDMIHLNSRDAYLEYWPGDEWVDILGLDAYDRNGDGFSDIPSLNSETAGFRAYYKTSAYTRITAEYHHTHEFRRGGDNLSEAPHMAMICEQLDHKIDGGGLRFDYFSPDSRHRMSVYTSAQGIDRSSYFGTDMNPEAYGATKDLTVVAGAQYTYGFDRLWFMPADLTIGAEYNYNTLDDSYHATQRRLEQKTSTAGFFFQNEWHSEKVNILIGGRLDKHNMVRKPIFSPRVNLRYSP